MYKKLNTKIIIIVIGFIIQLIGSYQVSWGISYSNYLKVVHNNTINNDFLYQLEIEHIQKNLYDTYLLQNYMKNLKNNVITHPYKKKSPDFLFHTSNMHLQNDSINISHVFYNYLNKHQKILPFIQIGFQNILSEKIFSLGGGNRYTHNNLCAIGYSIFYHFPVSNVSKQPYLFNINGEYWYHNILFMLNNFYRIDNSIYAKKITDDSTKYPKQGHQIHIQIQPSNCLKFAGKIILEHYRYKKEINKIFSNKNYNLILGVDYYPIPILGFNINKMFTNIKNNNVAYNILVNYQFNMPIMQQIYILKNKKINLEKFPPYNFIIKPFIPVITNINNKKEKDHLLCEDKKFPQYSKKIKGYPGEIKIIEIKNNNTENDDEPISVQWNVQSLKNFQNYGGNITLIKKNIYAIHIPYHPINKIKKIALFYSISNNLTKNKYSSEKKQILILIHDFQKETSSLSHPSCASTEDDTNTRKTNYDSDCNIRNDSEKIHKLDCSKNHRYNSKDNIHSNLSVISNTNIYHDALTNNEDAIKIYNSLPLLTCDENSFDHNSSSSNLPSKYPTPIISLSEENIKIMTKKNNTEEITTIPQSAISPPIPPPFPIPSLPTENSSSLFSPIKPEGKSVNYLNSNNDQQFDNDILPCYTSSFIQNQNDDSMLPQNTGINNNDLNDMSSLNQNLLHLLSIHKKLKFASVGTLEHINKLEKTTTNKKRKYPSEMEKLFARSLFSMHQDVTSSTDESYMTDDESSNN